MIEIIDGDGFDSNCEVNFLYRLHWGNPVLYIFAPISNCGCNLYALQRLLGKWRERKQQKLKEREER